MLDFRKKWIKSLHWVSLFLLSRQVHLTFSSSWIKTSFPAFLPLSLAQREKWSFSFSCQDFKSGLFYFSTVLSKLLVVDPGRTRAGFRTLIKWRCSLSDHKSSDHHWKADWTILMWRQIGLTLTHIETKIQPTKLTYDFAFCVLSLVL